MRSSARSLAALGLGAGLMLGLAGCEQSGTNGPEQAFNDLPENRVEAVETPLIAPKPTLRTTAAEAAAPDVTTEAPLVAVKPILGTKISEIQSNLSKSSATATSEIQPIKLLIPEKEFRPDPKTGVVRISYDDFDLLKILNMDPVPADAPKHFPEWLNQLDGRKVRVRGFMYPPQLEEGLTGFILARDNQICCFGREAKVYDLVNIFLKEGESTHYIQNRPFDVVGTFRINPLSDDKTLFQLYEIEDAEVIER